MIELSLSSIIVIAVAALTTLGLLAALYWKSATLSQIIPTFFSIAIATAAFIQAEQALLITARQTEEMETQTDIMRSELIGSTLYTYEVENDWDVYLHQIGGGRPYLPSTVALYPVFLTPDGGLVDGKQATIHTTPENIEEDENANPVLVFNDLRAVVCNVPETIDCSDHVLRWITFEFHKGEDSVRVKVRVNSP